MDYIKKLSRFFVPYKRFAILNIICNIFYALFGTLAMVSLMPMINILFGETEEEYIKPEFLSTWDYFSKEKIIDYFNFFITRNLF